MITQPREGYNIVQNSGFDHGERGQRSFKIVLHIICSKSGQNN
jgi:hypothetical protein